VTDVLAIVIVPRQKSVDGRPALDPGWLRCSSLKHSGILARLALPCGRIAILRRATDL
jgi:hypothetical protein